MKFPRKAYLIALSLAVLIAAGTWIANHQKSQPPQRRAGGPTDDEREELRRLGIVLLPGAEYVTSWRALDLPDFDTFSYALYGEFGNVEVEEIVDSLTTSLEEMGWDVGPRSNERGDWSSLRAANQERTLQVNYVLRIQISRGHLQTHRLRRDGLEITATSVRTNHPTPAP